MGRIFVMSDVHGQREWFFEALNRVDFSPEDHLYILGDVVDRGLHGIDLLKFIRTCENMTLILGNHEEMMLSAVETGSRFEFDSWISNGGTPTYYAYDALHPVAQKSLCDYLNACPIYQVVEVEGSVYLLTHAGIRPFLGETLEEQLEQQHRDDLLWIREDFLFSDLSNNPFTVIHGHTPMHYYKTIGKQLTRPDISIEPGRIGIDAGAGAGHGLTIYCLNTQEAVYISDAATSEAV